MRSYHNNQKKIIGILCCDELHATFTNERDTPPKYIYDDRGVRLCEWRTWKKVATGSASPNDKIYDYLMKKTGYTFNDNEALENEVNQQLNLLLAAIEIGAEQDRVKPCQAMISALEPHKNEFYYKELFQASQSLNQSYVDGQYIDSESFALYLRIMDCFPTVMQALLKNAMFQYAAYFDGNITLINQVMTTFDFEHSYHFLQVKFAQWLMYNRNFIDAYQKFSELEGIFEKENNLVFLLETCNIKTNLANEVATHEVDDLERKIEAIITQYGSLLPTSKIAHTYYMKGMRHFARKEYSQAIDCLQLRLDFGTNGRERECNIYLVYLRKKCKIDDPLALLDDSLVYEDETITTICYRYFVMQKREKDNESLAQYILNDIVSSFTELDLFYIEIFLYEIRALSKKLRKHKYVTKYIEKIDKIRKNIG